MLPLLLGDHTNINTDTQPHINIMGKLQALRNH